MNRTVKQTLHILLLVMYLLSATFVALGHDHPVVLSLGSSPAVCSHDCGPNERHKPLDSDKDCFLCQRIHQFVPAMFDVSPAAIIQTRQTAAYTSSPRHISSGLLSVPPRGPPSLIS